MLKSSHYNTQSGGRRSTVPSMRPGLNRGMLLGIPAIMFGLPLCSWIAFLKIIHDGHGDFRHFYAAGWILRTGNRTRLYDYSVQKLVQDSRISPEHLALPFN